MDYFLLIMDYGPSQPMQIRCVAEPVLAVKHGRVGGALAYTQAHS